MYSRYNPFLFMVSKYSSYGDITFCLFTYQLIHLNCFHFLAIIKGFLSGSAGKESACNMGHLGSIPGPGRSPQYWKGYPLQYSGLENCMDCRSWSQKESDTTKRLSPHFGYYQHVAISNNIVLYGHLYDISWAYTLKYECLVTFW